MEIKLYEGPIRNEDSFKEAFKLAQKALEDEKNGKPWKRDENGHIILK